MAFTSSASDRLGATPTGRGYWLVATDGGIFSFGGARSYGSAAAYTGMAPAIGMVATPW